GGAHAFHHGTERGIALISDQIGAHVAQRAERDPEHDHIEVAPGLEPHRANAGTVRPPVLEIDPALSQGFPFDELLITWGVRPARKALNLYQRAIGLCSHS